MISIGFPGDEDDRYEDALICEKCKHELAVDLWGIWFCEICEPPAAEEEE